MRRMNLSRAFFVAASGLLLAWLLVVILPSLGEMPRPSSGLRSEASLGGASTPVSTGERELGHGNPSSKLDSHEIQVPFNFVFAGGSSVPAARSWSELVALYPQDQRDSILAFSSGLAASAYSFSTREELDWMVQRGFPMPADIVAANSMTNEELLGLALAGNTKAAFFHLNRIYSSDPNVNPARLIEEDKWRVKAAALSGESPFIGYLEAVRLAREYPDSPSAAAGALAWAALKGDRRATRELRQPGIDPESMLSWMLMLAGDEDQLRQLGYLRGNRSLMLDLRIPASDARIEQPNVDTH